MTKQHLYSNEALINKKDWRCSGWARRTSLTLREKQAEIKENFQCSLESYSSDEALDAQLSEDQDTINDMYAQISNGIDTLTPASESPSSGNSVASCSHNVRLPKLALKWFSGEPLWWVSFINLFDTRIYNNENLKYDTYAVFAQGFVWGTSLSGKVT